MRLYFRRAAKKTRRTTSVPSGTHASPQSTWRNSPASPSKRITGAAAAARTRFRPATKRYQLAALAVYGVVASARASSSIRLTGRSASSQPTTAGSQCAHGLDRAGRA